MKRTLDAMLLAVVLLVLGNVVVQAQNPQSLLSRITRLESQVASLNADLQMLQSQQHLVILSAFMANTAYSPWSYYNPDVVDFNSAAEYLSIELGASGGNIRVLKAGFYQIKWFNTYRLWKDEVNYAEDEPRFLLRVNDIVIARARVDVRMGVKAPTGNVQKYWDDEFNGTILRYFTEGEMAGTLAIDKIVYLNEGDRFHISMPWYPFQYIWLDLGAEYNGLQVRYLGK